MSDHGAETGDGIADEDAPIEAAAATTMQPLRAAPPTPEEALAMVDASIRQALATRKAVPDAAPAAEASHAAPEESIVPEPLPTKLTEDATHEGKFQPPSDGAVANAKLPPVLAQTTEEQSSTPQGSLPQENSSVPVPVDNPKGPQGEKASETDTSEASRTHTPAKEYPAHGAPAASVPVGNPEASEEVAVPAEGQKEPAHAHPPPPYGYPGHPYPYYRPGYPPPYMHYPHPPYYPYGMPMPYYGHRHHYPHPPPRPASPTANTEEASQEFNEHSFLVKDFNVNEGDLKGGDHREVLLDDGVVPSDETIRISEAPSGHDPTYVDQLLADRRHASAHLPDRGPAAAARPDDTPEPASTVATAEAVAALAPPPVERDPSPEPVVYMPGLPRGEESERKPTGSPVPQLSNRQKRKRPPQARMEFPSAANIERAFPPTASSVIEFYDRKINMDHFPAHGPLYPILRAWVRDDPFRTTPREEANIDFLRARATRPPRKVDPMAVMSLEVGPGGRYDATKLLGRDAYVTVVGVTLLDYDHVRVEKPMESAPAVHVSELEGTMKHKSMVPTAQPDDMDEDQDDDKSVQIDTLRQEMIQRAKRIRRQKSRRINREFEEGRKSLRERGISI